MKVVREIQVPGRWCVHSYYIRSPYAPDGSGRLLLAGADMNTLTGKVFVIGPDGSILDEFGEKKVESNFFHTGLWQSWSADCRYVYYESGTLQEPWITRRELETGREIRIEGDAEGTPPHGEPAVSGLLGMLYAAGYGYLRYQPEIAPVPFEERDRHGLFEYTFEPGMRKLRLSVNQVLSIHPEQEFLRKEDRRLAELNGTPAGLTLMCYCVRWSPDGQRMMFHFGNHCVVRERQEPRLVYIFTCKRDFSDLHLAVSWRQNGGGAYWSWHPDGEHLTGNVIDPETGAGSVAMVRYDGLDFHKICDAPEGGHVSVCPSDPEILVIDNTGGMVDFWDLQKNRMYASQHFPNTWTGAVREGRNRTRCCHHPVFTKGGEHVLFNAFSGDLCRLIEIETPRRK